MTLPEKFAARVLSELGPEEGGGAVRRTRYRAARVRAAEPCQMCRCGRTRSGAGRHRGGTGRIRIAAGELRDGCARPASGFAKRRRPCTLVRRRVLPGGAAAVHLRQRFPCRGILRAGGVVAVRGAPDGRRGVAGKRILDLCAAPGGKTTLYASLAGPDGLVVANEIDRRRAQVLADNVRKWGTGNVAVTTCEPRQLGDFEAWFDMVAVDAPCSGEGMFRKDAQARAEWSEGNVKLCAARQDGILREAWRALKPGGRLIYSTCTFNRDEDEGALERMLAWAGDEVAEAEDMAVDGAWGIVCGRVGAFRTYRFYPYRARGEGFFRRRGLQGL